MAGERYAQAAGDVLMPDLCKCEGYDCPKKNECYRFRCSSDKYCQAYFLGKPYREGQECIHFIPIDDRKNLKPIEN